MYGHETSCGYRPSKNIQFSVRQISSVGLKQKHGGQASSALSLMATSDELLRLAM
jgi:hypothetical protein